MYGIPPEPRHLTRTGLSAGLSRGSPAGHPYAAARNVPAVCAPSLVVWSRDFVRCVLSPESQISNRLLPLVPRSAAPAGALGQ